MAADIDPFAPVDGQINTLMVNGAELYMMHNNSNDSENEGQYGEGNPRENRIYQCHIEDCLK